MKAKFLTHTKHLYKITDTLCFNVHKNIKIPQTERRAMAIYIFTYTADILKKYKRIFTKYILKRVENSTNLKITMEKLSMNCTIGIR